ncbi:MAG: transglutaminase-like domain-containing protein [Clostridium sp.]
MDKKHIIGATIAGIIMLSTVVEVSNSYLNIERVYAAESRELKTAKVSVDKLVVSMKKEGLTLKSQEQWQKNINQCRDLIKKIGKSETKGKNDLYSQVAKVEILVNGLASVNKVENSIANSSKTMANAEKWSRELNAAKAYLNKIDKTIYNKQYTELLSRINKGYIVVKDIEDKFNIDYNSVAKLYDEAKISKNRDKLNVALKEAEKLWKCSKSDKLVLAIKDTITDIVTGGIFKVYQSSINFKKEWLKIEVLNTDQIKIVGKTSLNKVKSMIQIEGKNSIIDSCYFKSDGTWEIVVNMGSEFVPGDYKINILYSDPSNPDEYNSYYYGIPLKYSGGEVYFPKPAIYKHNYIEYEKNSKLNPKEYLESRVTNPTHSQEIKKLAQSIVAGTSDNYEKLIKINEWVASNIYYNYDGYYSGNYGDNDAYSVLKNRKSVCQGYSELTEALLKSIGIPTRLATGHAIWLSQSWDNVNHSKSNHAWNEAYVNGRWVILDTTWNSSNRFENGKFKKGNIKYNYFDPTLEGFSITHKILSIK